MGTPEQDLREYLNREDAEDSLASAVEDRINLWMESKTSIQDYLDSVLEWQSDNLSEKITEAISSDDPQAWNNFGEWIETQIRNAMREDAAASVKKDADQLATDVAVDREEARRYEG